MKYDRRYPVYYISILLLILISFAGCGKSKPAVEVDKLINYIGEVTIDSESDITAAEEYYNSLTENQKDEVENYKKLLDARKELDELLHDQSSSYNGEIHELGEMISIGNLNICIDKVAFYTNVKGHLVGGDTDYVTGYNRSDSDVSKTNLVYYGTVENTGKESFYDIPYLGQFSVLYDDDYSVEADFVLKRVGIRQNKESWSETMADWSKVKVLCGPYSLNGSFEIPKAMADNTDSSLILIIPTPEGEVRYRIR